MPRLTEQERQEVIRCLEADKPLPERYRFLLFEDKREVELVWNGKTNEVCNLVLPFQTIEQVDEPRAERKEDTEPQLRMFDQRGRQLKGWTNKLIWGDNKLILSSLKNGPMREEIERQGGLKLVYIDPPFDVGADFSMDVEIGDDTFTKRPSIIEEIAYRDTWGKGVDSFNSMIYERLMLIHALMSDTGVAFIHMGWGVSHHVRAVADEVFGSHNIINHVVWKRQTAHSDSGQGASHLGRIHDDILVYAKTSKYRWGVQYAPYSNEYLSSHYQKRDETTGRRYELDNLTAPGGSSKGNPYYALMGVERNWRYSESRMAQLVSQGRIVQPSPGAVPRYKRYLDEMPGVPIQDIWDDVNAINSQAKEAEGYATQKPEALLSRVIQLASVEGDLVADFFCGSGTTAAVAEKLGRKWICTDLGKFAIHTTRKRMIGVQRGLKAEGKDFRAFEILNLGRYERQHYVGVNPNLREEERRRQTERKEAAFVDLILRAYKAEKVDGFKCFLGKRSGRLVAIGPVNLPVTRLFVEEVILEARQKRLSKVDILGFEFEMGLFPNVLDEARGKGIDISPKYIPAEVFDKRAVEKGQVTFHDVAAIEVKPIVVPGKKGTAATLAVELTDFSVFYSQDSVKKAEEALKPKASKIVVEKGQIVKVSKDAKGIVSKEVLTKQWTDWIDYWAVDFAYERKREIIRVQNGDTGEWEEKWTGEYVFENEWQSFRTKKERKLELTSVPHACEPGRRKVAVKVVDIFGNDTMTIVDVTIPAKR
jgi:adenine-specific DNA-methyltransferase